MSKEYIFFIFSYIFDNPQLKVFFFHFCSTIKLLNHKQFFCTSTKGAKNFGTDWLNLDSQHGGTHRRALKCLNRTLSIFSRRSENEDLDSDSKWLS